MVKPGKSSASSNTRKKHAKKSGPGENETGPESASNNNNNNAPHQKKQRGQKLTKAQKKALPKIKQYIPPPKPPAPPIPDPLDGQGLARTLPAELVVVLRRLGKKDDVTRRKGLEELKDGWVGVSISSQGDELEREMKETALLSAVPVWMHNLASLLQSPFHRTTALQLHNDLLSIPSIQTSILETLSLSLLPETQNRDILGSWLVASLEEGRRSGGSGIKVWEESTTLSPQSSESASSSSTKIDLTPQIPTLIEYLSLSILDPATLHEDIHPPPISVSSGTSSPAPSARVLAKSTKVRPSSLVTPTLASPASQEDEVETERWARYRVGGLIGLSWLIQRLSSLSFPMPSGLLTLLKNPVFWTSLSPLESPGPSSIFSPDIVSLGWQQPPIRRAACTVLGVLVDSYPSEVEQNLNLISESVLGSCWLEKEAVVWESAGSSVVKFLSKYRKAWEITGDDTSHISSAQHEQESADEDDGDDGDDDDDGSDNDDEGREDAEDAKKDDSVALDISITPKSAKSAPFSDLLSFIATTCPQIPHLTYPLLLVIISTVPATLLPLAPADSSEIDQPQPTPSAQLANLLSHLWSPFDSRLLSTHSLPNTPSAFQSFLTAALDITTYLIGKSYNTPGGRETAHWLVSTQLGERVWKEGVLGFGGRARVRPGDEKEKETVIFGGAMDRVWAVDTNLCQEIVSLVGSTLIQSCFDSEGNTVLKRSLGLLRALKMSTSHLDIHSGLDVIVVEIAEGCFERLEKAEKVELVYVETIVQIMETESTLLDNDLLQKLATLLINRANSLADTLPPAVLVSLFSLVVKSAPASSQEQIVQSLWTFVDHSNASQSVRFAVVDSLLSGSASEVTLLTEGSLDKVAIEATETALSGGMQAGLSASVAASSITTHHVSQDALHTILALISTSTHDSVMDSLATQSHASSVPQASLIILASYAKDHMADLIDSDIWCQAVIGVHHLVHLLPRVSGDSASSHAIEIWRLTESLDQQVQAGLQIKVMESLATLLAQTSCRVDPGVLIDAAAATCQGEITSLLPPFSKLESQLSICTSQPPHPSLPIVDTLVPYTESYQSPNTRATEFDSSGRSSLARHIQAILIFLRSDRNLAIEKPELLKIALAGSILAKDAISVPGCSRGLYSASTPTVYLEDIIRDTEGVLSYTLSKFDELQYAMHTAAVQKLRASTDSVGDDFLQTLILTLKDQLVKEGGDVTSRVLRDVLSRVMRQSGAGEKEAEVWLGYAMTLVERVPQLAVAIILAIKPIMQDSRSFSTAQNRLASALTTIPTRQISKAGIAHIRLLNATAPPQDAASLFIPQQRAIFVLKHVSGWLVDEDDEGMSEDVEWRVLELYSYLGAVVQDLQGSHWDSIFDLVENGLEASAMDEVSTHCLLYQSLVVLQQIRELCASNKSLRASWTSKDVHMKLVLKLFLECRDADSMPLQMIQTLILDLLPDVPEGVKAQASMTDLCDLLKLSKSSTIQSAAYRVLNQVIRQSTMTLVLQVEASVAEAEDGHAVASISLPSELLEIVELGRGVSWDTAPIHTILGQLLAWLAILDHFEDASTSLRWAYLDQLTSGKLLGESLLPMLFAMLGVSEMGAWNFPASQYAVDEFYPDLLVPEEVSDLVPLASHVFYRSLVTIPSAMRTFYESLKDRQLSLSLLTFTTKHYSPTIISHELSTLRQPSALATLTEEGLNVRIISGGGGITSVGSGGAEAIASYVVDEQPMEIGIRLPAEFPLRGVDVRDLRRVGVPENKWRGWLMSVQQTITSRNGLILEALTVFKRNVSLHFDGVVECAICYSIISLTDRTLPTKPCRTCKNRFHASCLFKWFNSSHTSSCPLCRSLF